jgi:ketopantoate reductase
MELEAIVGAVIELGEIVGVQMPNIRAVYTGTKLLGEIVAKGRTTRAAP